MPEPRPTYGPAWSATLRRGTESELRGWVEAALGWCDEADAIALRHFRANPVTTRKPDRTFVTEADTAVERMLRDRIAAAFPDHGVVGEEFGDEATGAATQWIVDPIDGTHNYLRGVPIFATLMAVRRDGELQAGIVSAPALGSRWYAWRGGGAWATHSFSADGGTIPRRLGVTALSDVGEAQVLHSGVRDMAASGRAPGFDGLLDAAWRARGYSDFWGYMLVAEGAAEAMLEVGLSIWDIAAPAVIVEEAGGLVTDFAGRRDLAGGTTLATNGRLHEAIRARLVEPLDEGRSP